jgi:predicted ATPase
MPNSEEPYFAGVFFADLRRDPAALQHHLDAMIAFDREHGYSRSGVAFFQGMSLFNQGLQTDGVALAQQTLARMSSRGGERRTYMSGRLAETYAQLGEADRAWQTIVEAQSLCEQSAEHSWDAELHRIAGEILFLKGANTGDVAARFQRAIQTAHQQGAKSLELRAALSFSRLLISHGRAAEARDLLAPIYAWFTEGFATSDLREARTVLTEMEA